VPEGVEIVLSTDGDGAYAERSYPATPGQLRYEDTIVTPDEHVHLVAYVDFDGDFVRDPEEPWGIDPNGEIDLENNDGYRGVIVIEPP